MSAILAPGLRALWRFVQFAFLAGAASGWLEAIVRVVRQPAPTESVWLGVHFWWMPALGNGLLFTAAAALVSPLVLIRPSAGRSTLATALVLALFALNIGLAFPLHFASYATSLLALGAGFALARLVENYASHVERAVGRLIIPVLALLVVIPGTIQLQRFAADRRALAREGPTGARPPNILLLVFDTMRPMSTSAYGYHRRTTPNLETLAARGMRFDRAYSTAPWSLPAHASLLTGRWSNELSANWATPLDGTFPTLAEVLVTHGFQTGGFVGNLFYTTRSVGLARGFDHFEDFPLSPRQILSSSQFGRRVAGERWIRRWRGPEMRAFHRKSAVELNGALLRWIDGLGDRPFFAFVNYFDAHDRFYFGDFPLFPEYFPNSPPRGTSLNEPFKPVRSLRKYESALGYLDRELGRLLAALETRGRLAETVIIVTSDHGEEFQEHGIPGHGNSLYLPVLRIPLVISHPPQVPSGAVIPNPVSSRDLAATILALAGIEESTLIPGASLTRFVGAPPDAPADTLFAEVRQGIRTPPAFPVSRGDMRSAIAGGMQLILDGDGRVELFDVERDPWEQQNLAGNPAYAGEIAGLVATLRALPGPGKPVRDR